MDIPLAASLSVAVVAAIISPGVHAENNELADVSCVHFRIPDLLNISECLNNVLHLCGKHKNYIQLAMEKLGRCIMDKIFAIRSLKAILTALRKPIIFGFKTLFPKVSKVVVPVLKALIPKPCNARQLKEGNCDRQLLPQNPCNSTVTVTFSDPLDIRDCIDISRLMCFEKDADKDEILAELMKTIVCAMKKLPALNVRLMLKKILCRVMAWLVEFLRVRDFNTMGKVVEAFHTLGNCHRYYPMDPKAERRLLPEAELWLPNARHKLLQ